MWLIVILIKLLKCQQMSCLKKGLDYCKRIIFINWYGINKINKKIFYKKL